jgi:hypothetical protein
MLNDSRLRFRTPGDNPLPDPRQIIEEAMQSENVADQSLRRFAKQDSRQSCTADWFPRHRQSSARKQVSATAPCDTVAANQNVGHLKLGPFFPVATGSQIAG